MHSALLFDKILLRNQITNISGNCSQTIWHCCSESVHLWSLISAKPPNNTSKESKNPITMASAAGYSNLRKGRRPLLHVSFHPWTGLMSEKGRPAIFLARLVRNVWATGKEPSAGTNWVTQCFDRLYTVTPWMAARDQSIHLKQGVESQILSILWQYSNWASSFCKQKAKPSFAVRKTDGPKSAGRSPPSLKFSSQGAWPRLEVASLSTLQIIKNKKYSRWISFFIGFQELKHFSQVLLLPSTRSLAKVSARNEISMMKDWAFQLRTKDERRSTGN